jgi:hypothetical protein
LADWGDFGVRIGETFAFHARRRIGFEGGVKRDAQGFATSEVLIS